MYCVFYVIFGRVLVSLFSRHYLLLHRHFSFALPFLNTNTTAVVSAVAVSAVADVDEAPPFALCFFRNQCCKIS